MASPVLAQRSDIPRDYLGVRPELLNQLPPPQRVIDEAPGETEEIRDAWRVGTFLALRTAISEMQGKRQWDNALNRETDAERRIKDAYREAADLIERERGEGAWRELADQIQFNKDLTIYARYFPAYLNYYEARSGRALRDAEIDTIEEIEAAQAEQEREEHTNAIVSALLVLMLVVGVIAILLLAIDGQRRRLSADKRAISERADAILRACLGMSEERFAATTKEERREALVAQYPKREAPLRLAGDFRRDQRHVGSLSEKLPIAVRHFQIKRSRASLSDNWDVLMANALVYNEGFISADQMDVRGLSLIYQDGMAQVAHFERWSVLGKYDGQVHTVDDALAYIINHRYMKAQSAKEETRVTLFELREAHPGSEIVERAAAWAGLGDST